MNEDENDCGCNCRGMHHGMHKYGRMHGMGMRQGMMDNTEEDLGPLHKEKLVEKLKLYKEDLEEQVKFIAKRIDELEGKSKDGEK